MEQFGGWYQKERKLPGSGGGAPAFVYRPIPYLHGPCPLLETSFSQGDQEKRKRGLFGPVSFMRFTDAYQNCPECR